jgi:hypothetical protein
MNNPVLKTRRKVVSTIILAYPGGRKCAADHISLPLKKFDNHAYENNNSRPLTDVQIHKLETQTGTQHLPTYIAAMYGGLFVPIMALETLDNVEMYTLSVQTAARQGTVDQAIAKALADGWISGVEAEQIINTHQLHMAARHAEVLAAIDLYRAKPGKGQ